MKRKPPLYRSFNRLLDILRLKSLMGKTLVIALPYGWHIFFFFIPFLFILGISFSTGSLSIPPFEPLFTWSKDHVLWIKLNFSNYLFLIEDSLYVEAYRQSVILSALATLLCLIIGYPMAYVISRTKQPYRTILLLFIVLPFWTSFLIRIYAWIGILSPQGLINTLLLHWGWIQSPLELMHNNFSVCLGIVYSYLPFMILPIYSVLEKMDDRLLEAAYNLGCRPFQAFLKITWPLSYRGVLAGTLLVFIPGVGEFIIPELLGGPDSIMIGKVLWTEFFFNRDWPLASALAMALLLLLVLPIFMVQKLIATRKDAV
jgi:putrescine transport system permease protein